MDDLISRSALFEKIQPVDFLYGDDEAPAYSGMAVSAGDIESAPAVEAVEVVRCYKCKQSERMESPFGTVVHCHCWNKTVDYDGFCYEGY